MLFFTTLGLLMLACLTLAGVLDEPLSPSQIPGSYIVWLKKETTTDEIRQHVEWVKKVHESSVSNPLGYGGFRRLYVGVLELAHYTGDFDPQTIQKIEEHPAVFEVTPNFAVHFPEHFDEKPEPKPEPEPEAPEYISIPNVGTS